MDPGGAGLGREGPTASVRSTVPFPRPALKRPSGPDGEHFLPRDISGAREGVDFWPLDMTYAFENAELLIKAQGLTDKGHTAEVTFTGFLPSFAVKVPPRLLERAREDPDELRACGEELRVGLERQLRKRAFGPKAFYERLSEEERARFCAVPPRSRVIAQSTGLEETGGAADGNVEVERDFEGVRRIRRTTDIIRGMLRMRLGPRAHEVADPTDEREYDSDDEESQALIRQLRRMEEREESADADEPSAKRAAVQSPQGGRGAVQKVKKKTVSKSEQDEEKEDQQCTTLAADSEAIARRWGGFQWIVREVDRKAQGLGGDGRLVPEVRLCERGRSLYGWTRRATTPFWVFRVAHPRLVPAAKWATWELARNVLASEPLEVFEANVDFLVNASAQLNVSPCKWLSLRPVPGSIRIHDALLAPDIASADVLERGYGVSPDAGGPQLQMRVDTRNAANIEVVEPQPRPPMQDLVCVSVDLEVNPPESGHFPRAASGHPVSFIGINVQHKGETQLHCGWWGGETAPVPEVEGIQVTMHHCRDEHHLLHWLVDMLHQLDVDVITGWNTLGFDFPYVLDRFRLGPWLDLETAPADLAEALRGPLRAAEKLHQAALRLRNAQTNAHAFAFQHGLNPALTAWAQRVLRDTHDRGALGMMTGRTPRARPECARDTTTANAVVRSAPLAPAGLRDIEAALAWLYWALVRNKPSRGPGVRVWFPAEMRGGGDDDDDFDEPPETDDGITYLTPERGEPFWEPVWLADDLLAEGLLESVGHFPYGPESEEASRFESSDTPRAAAFVRAPRWAVAQRDRPGSFQPLALSELTRMLTHGNPAVVEQLRVFRATPAARYLHLGRVHPLRVQALKEPDARPGLFAGARPPTLARKKEFKSSAHQWTTSELIGATTGRVYTDEMLAIKLSKKLPSYSLDNVAKTMLKVPKYDMGYHRLRAAWSTPEGRAETAFYVCKDAYLPARIKNKRKGDLYEVSVSRVTGAPLRTIILRGSEFRSFAALLSLLHDYHRRGDPRVFVPTFYYLERTKEYFTHSDTFVGAACLTPLRQYHRDIVLTLDFESLYPNTMREGNMSWDTLIPPPADLPEDPAEARAAWERYLAEEFELTLDDVFIPEDIEVDPVTYAVKSTPIYSAGAFVQPQPGGTRTGYLCRMMTHFLEERKRYKKLKKDYGNEAQALAARIKELAEDDPELPALREALAEAQANTEAADGAQQGLKIVANSTYGVIGSRHSSLVCFPIATAITGRGRQLIYKCAELTVNRFNRANGYPFNAVIGGGDTDSIFVILRGLFDSEALSDEDRAQARAVQYERILKEPNPFVPDSVRYLFLAWEYAKEMEAALNYMLQDEMPYNRTRPRGHPDRAAASPQRMEAEKFKDGSVNFKKKRYAGLELKPAKGGFEVSLTTSGLESARRDATDFVKRVQKEFLHIALVRRDLDAAFAFVHDSYVQLATGRVPLHELLLTKSLTRPIGEYKAANIAVELAHKTHPPPPVGTRFYYLITLGSPELTKAKKAETPETILERDMPIDYGHYAEAFRKSMARTVAPFLVVPRPSVARMFGHRVARPDMEHVHRKRKRGEAPKARVLRPQNQLVDPTLHIDNDRLEAIFSVPRVVRGAATLVQNRNTRQGGSAPAAGGGLKRFFQARATCASKGCKRPVEREGADLCADCARRADAAELRGQARVELRTQLDEARARRDELNSVCYKCVSGDSKQHRELIRDCTTYGCGNFWDRVFHTQRMRDLREQVEQMGLSAEEAARDLEW